MGRFAKPFGTHSGLGTGFLAQRYTPTNLVSKAAEDARTAVQMCNRLCNVLEECATAPTATIELALRDFLTRNGKNIDESLVGKVPKMK